MTELPKSEVMARRSKENLWHRRKIIFMQINGAASSGRFTTRFPVDDVPAVLRAELEEAGYKWYLNAEDISVNW